jgi:hypothetical protein
MQNGCPEFPFRGSNMMERARLSPEPRGFGKGLHQPIQTTPNGAHGFGFLHHRLGMDLDRPAPAWAENAHIEAAKFSQRSAPYGSVLGVLDQDKSSPSS